MSALIFDSLAFWQRDIPDKVAVIMDDRRLTYHDLAVWSDGVAAHLQGAGVGPGDVIVITGVNSIEWIVAAFGALKTGAILAPLNYRFVRDEFAHLIGATRPKVTFADRARREIISQLDGVGDTRQLWSMEDLSELAASPSPWRRPDVSPEATALLLCTSGTTGYPKLVMFTHQAILASHFEWKLFQPNFTREMRHLLALPLHGTPGMTWGFLNTVTNGGTFVLQLGYNAKAVLAAMVEHRITSFPGVPMIFEQVSALPEFDDADLSSLVNITTGGARVSPELMARWRGKGISLRQIYGLTEIGGYASVCSEAEVTAGADTCGCGGPYTRIRILAPDGSECPPGVAGEVLVRGPGQLSGYWGDEKATAEAIVDGWLHTGDLGLFAENGCFKFVDRAKDMIISGGYNISPAEIERVIAQCDGIVEVSVFGVEDKKFGETPMAVYYASSDIEPKSIVDYCCERLADFKIPRYAVRMVEPLPRMSSGKIDKRLLRSRFASAPQNLVKLR